jgi:hypothetical protein
MVRITLNGKQKFIGQFDEEEDAVYALDMFIIHTPGYEDYNINFSDKIEEYKNVKYDPSKKREIKSIYKGVGKDTKNPNIYIGRVYYKGVTKQVYRGDDEEDCAFACDLYIAENNIPGRELNFPDEFPDYNSNCIVKTLYEPIGNGVIKLLISSDDKNIILINEEDYDKVKNFICYLDSDKYVRIKVDKLMYLHRYLMDPEERKIVDHIDGNKSNNCKNNLRIMNRDENSQNMSKQEKPCSSKYLGVSHNTLTKKWEAYVCFRGKTVYHKSFNDEETAAKNRDLYIKENLKSAFYKMNFKWDDEDIEELKNKGWKISN